MLENKTTGLIMLKDEFGIEYKVCKIEYILREDESFEYIFTPCYFVIDLLPASLFQGIPGLDLDLRLEKYIRSDRVPVFISERTPGPGRVDLDELLSSVGMNYLNRLEWLIKSKLTYFGDSLYVLDYDETLYSDFIWNTKQKDIGALEYTTSLISAIAHGRILILDGKIIEGEELSLLYKVLLDILCSNKKRLIKRREIGRNDAAINGRIAGRKKINVDSRKFDEIVKKYEKKEINADEATRILGISRSTFFRRMKSNQK